MADLLIKNMKKIYKGDVTAVHDFNLKIEDKEFIVLVGPSGCGKSTTLRMVAGLEDISEGELYIDGKLVNEIAPKDRDIAMVFQNYALYPHMTVYDNMAFALKMRKISKSEINDRVTNAARVLELEPYLQRKPKALSGGQRQRVALGRAMVRNPKVFLLDEPLSNLDAKLRVAMRTEIVKLYRQLGTTFIYVTHDQTEAMTMGTRIVVMKDGIIQQVDTPQNLYDYPCNKFVGEFIGSPQMNMIKADLIKTENDIYVCFDNYRLKLGKNIVDRLNKDAINKSVYMGIRPEDFSEKVNNENTGQEMDVQVISTEAMGSDTYLYFTTQSCERNVTARVSPYCKAGYQQKITLTVNTDKLHFFESETGVTLLNSNIENAMSPISESCCC